MANIGYIRVSTDKQDLSNQKRELERYILNNKMIIDKIIDIEISSRKTLEDRKINELFNMLEKGDNLLVSELSRLARSVKELEVIIDTFKSMQVNVILIKEGLTIKYNDDNPMSKMFIQLLGMFAEFERNIISMRTRQALASRKGKGILGHKQDFRSSKYDAHEQAIYNFRETANISFEKICQLLDFKKDLGFKAQSLRTWFNTRYEKDELTNTYQKTAKYKKHTEKKI